MIAVANKHSEIVDLLLKAGANPNVANVHGRTPLAFAARYGLDWAVDALLAFGAEPDFREGFFFESPLEAAARCGNVKIVDMLLTAGADPASKGHLEKTALESAEEAGHGEIAAKLRREIKRVTKSKSSE